MTVITNGAHTSTLFFLLSPSLWHLYKHLVCTCSSPEIPEMYAAGMCPSTAAYAQLSCALARARRMLEAEAGPDAQPLKARCAACSPTSALGLCCSSVAISSGEEQSDSRGGGDALSRGNSRRRKPGTSCLATGPCYCPLPPQLLLLPAAACC